MNFFSQKIEESDQKRDRTRQNLEKLNNLKNSLN
jgi:hypothetical protein